MESKTCSLICSPNTQIINICIHQTTFTIVFVHQIFTTYRFKEKLGVVLTKTQKGILEDVRKRKEDIEATKEELFAKQKELANLKRDEVEDVFREEDDKGSCTHHNN